jgi:hypothetical protein
MDIDIPEPPAPGLIDYPDSELPDPEATHFADNYPTIYLLLVD